MIPVHSSAPEQASAGGGVPTVGAIRPTPLDRPRSDPQGSTQARHLCAAWRRSVKAAQARKLTDAELRAQDEADEAAYQAEGDRLYGNSDLPRP